MGSIITIFKRAEVGNKIFQAHLFNNVSVPKSNSEIPLLGVRIGA